MLTSPANLRSVPLGPAISLRFWTFGAASVTPDGYPVGTIGEFPDAIYGDFPDFAIYHIEVVAFVIVTLGGGGDSVSLAGGGDSITAGASGDVVTVSGGKA